MLEVVYVCIIAIFPDIRFSVFCRSFSLASSVVTL